MVEKWKKMKKETVGHELAIYTHGIFKSGKGKMMTRARTLPNQRPKSRVKKIMITAGPNTTNSRIAKPDKGHAPDIPKTHEYLDILIPSLPETLSLEGSYLVVADELLGKSPLAVDVRQPTAKGLANANPSKNRLKDNAPINGLIVHGLCETPSDRPMINESSNVVKAAIIVMKPESGSWTKGFLGRQGLDNTDVASGSMCTKPVVRITPAAKALVAIKKLESAFRGANSCQPTERQL
ncbi:hypothetical protein Tco_1265575 [Tanacetum coccineum]